MYKIPTYINQLWSVHQIQLSCEPPTNRTVPYFGRDGIYSRHLWSAGYIHDQMFVSSVMPLSVLEPRARALDDTGSRNLSMLTDTEKAV